MTFQDVLERLERDARLAGEHLDGYVLKFETALVMAAQIEANRLAIEELRGTYQQIIAYMQQLAEHLDSARAGIEEAKRMIQHKEN